MHHDLLFHAFHAIATSHRVTNYLLYDHLSHSDFGSVLCSSACSREAYTFERSRVVNHTDTLGLVVLLISSVGEDLDLEPASSPRWGEARLYPFRVRRAL